MISLLLSLLLGSIPAGAINTAARAKLSDLGALRSVVALINNQNELVCSGTLISRGHVLTSAHCVDQAIRVAFVKHNGKIDQLIKVSQIHVHPEWLTKTPGKPGHEKLRAGDLAILELSEDISDPFYQPMPIDYYFEVADKKEPRVALVAGFGYTAEFQKPSPTKVELTVGFGRFHRGSDLGTIVIGGKTVICRGDSGGPAAVYQNGEILLVAINTGTTACDYREGFGYATGLRPYQTWILSHLP